MNDCIGCPDTLNVLPLDWPVPTRASGQKHFLNQDIYERLEALEKRVAELEGKRETEFPLDGGLTAS